ncbi:MAG TPA: phage holin family protein [Woeseiaceae bacterium]
MNRREPGSTPNTRAGHSPVIGDGDNGATRYEDESVPGLVRKLASDLSTLFSQELALAKAEMTAAVKDVRGGVSSMAIGGGVLYAGLLFLLGGVMLLLGYWVELPIAALIVGAVVTIIGAILLNSGKKRMEADSLKPERTIDSVKKDADLARRKMQ